MRPLAAAAIALALATVPAAAGELYIYEHNGSVMDVFIVGDSIKISYSRPKAGLSVQPGTVVFNGAFEAGKIVGTAYVFRSGCEPAPYDVIGDMTADGDRLVLKGPSPIREKGGCKVLRYSGDSPNATLVFTYSATHH